MTKSKFFLKFILQFKSFELKKYFTFFEHLAVKYFAQKMFTFKLLDLNKYFAYEISWTLLTIWLIKPVYFERYLTPQNVNLKIVYSKNILHQKKKPENNLFKKKYLIANDLT